MEIVITIASKLFDTIIVLLYIYLIYKLFKSTIKSYENGQTEKMTIKIIVMAILCFPIAIIELLYIQVILK